MKTTGDTGVTPLAKFLPASWTALRAQLAARWQAWAPRERAGFTAAGVLIAVLLVWVIAVRPAWRTLSVAPAQIDQLESQWQTMRRLAAEAAELRNMAPISAMQSSTALLAATDRLGPRARLIVQDDRATVTFNALPGGDLQSWLIEVRSAARARVIEAQLSRDALGYAGTVVLSLKAGS
jgi:general secretion pathway protein M